MYNDLGFMCELTYGYDRHGCFLWLKFGDGSGCPITFEELEKYYTFIGFL
jgi:hypothetical protein